MTSLRWFAASAVFLRHADIFGRYGAAGAVGVSFFFMLSGFVLTWAAREQGPRDFFVRRLARVYPTYAVSVVGSAVVLVAVGVKTIRQDLVPALLTLTLHQSWIPDSTYYYGGNLVAWSLSDEAFFYLAFPLIMVSISGLVSTNRIRLAGSLCTLSLVAVFVPLVVQPAPSGGLGFWFVYINPAFRLIEFVIGMLLAHGLRRGLLPKVRLLPAVVATSVGYAVASHVPAYAMWSAVTLVPFACLIVAASQADLSDSSPRMLKSAMMQRLGRWSYAFYLVHSLVIIVTRAALRKFDLELPTIPVMLLVYLVVVGLAGLLHEVIEAPAERWVRRRWLSSDQALGSSATVN